MFWGAMIKSAGSAATTTASREKHEQTGNSYVQWKITPPTHLLDKFHVIFLIVRALDENAEPCISNGREKQKHTTHAPKQRVDLAVKACNF